MKKIYFEFAKSRERKIGIYVILEILRNNIKIYLLTIRRLRKDELVISINYLVSKKTWI